MLPELVSNQAYVFLWTVAGGILIGIAYDFFRIFRKFIKAGNIAVFFEDLAFWIIVSLVLFFVLFVSNDGGIRLYVFVGAALGAIFYFLTISPIFMRIVIGLIEWIEWLLKLFAKILIVPFSLLYWLLKRPARQLWKLGRSILRRAIRGIRLIIRYVATIKKALWKIRKNV